MMKGLSVCQKEGSSANLEYVVNLNPLKVLFICNKATSLSKHQPQLYIEITFQTLCTILVPL